jgi:hypothetical protein
MLDILYTDGKITFRDNATTASTQHVTNFDAAVNLKTWFNLRIEYYVDTVKPTIKVYLDGKLIGESNNYYNSHKDGATPTNVYTAANLYSMAKTESIMYVDNAYFAYETVAK